MRALRGPAARARQDAVVEFWRQGKSMSVIAAMLSIPISNVQHYVRCARKGNPDRVPRRRRERTEVESIVQQVAALRRQKRSYREIALELGISRDVVASYVRLGLASGLIPRSASSLVTGAQIQEIIAQNAAGISCCEIGRRMGVSHQNVSRILHMAGVAPRAVILRQQLTSQILTLWKAGWKTNAIADAFGTTAKNVRAIAYYAAAKNPALRRNASPFNAAEVGHITALRRQGYSGVEIAEVIDSDYSVVRRAVRKIAKSEPGLALDRRWIAKNRLPEVLLLMAQGLPSAAIAERFGIPRESMIRLLYQLRRRAKTRGAVIRPGVEVQSFPEG